MEVSTYTGYSLQAGSIFLLQIRLYIQNRMLCHSDAALDLINYILCYIFSFSLLFQSPTFIKFFALVLTYIYLWDTVRLELNKYEDLDGYIKVQFLLLISYITLFPTIIFRSFIRIEPTQIDHKNKTGSIIGSSVTLGIILQILAAIIRAIGCFSFFMTTVTSYILNTWIYFLAHILLNPSIGYFSGQDMISRAVVVIVSSIFFLVIELINADQMSSVISEMFFVPDEGPIILNLPETWKYVVIPFLITFMANVMMLTAISSILI
jgi:hypothetical protein